MSLDLAALRAAKGRLVRAAGSSIAAARRSRHPGIYRPGCTVVTVNWNSVEFLRRTVAAVTAMSPNETEILVFDNASTDGSRDYLDSTAELTVLKSPVNLGHGVALDIALGHVHTEYVAVLDVDAFPIADDWLDSSTRALEDGAVVAGARMHRNFVHPCFLVTKTETIHRYGLTFKPVGSLHGLTSGDAPLFLDVGEALSQRVIIAFGGSQTLHFFERTSVRGPGDTGAVFGDLVYHNQFATQGVHRSSAGEIFQEEFARHHPSIEIG